MTDLSDLVRQHVLELVWSLWSELGVSGWTRRHRNWCVDPEPLIVFTATLRDTDPRLRDESTDWCVRFGRFVSNVRLKAVLRQWDSDRLEGYAEYAATVTAHAGVKWPLAGRARTFHPSQKSRVEAFLSPGQVSLRLRALFGVGARAELVRLLLGHSDARTGMTAAALSSASLYGKRNVLLELDSLVLSGAVKRSTEGNRQLFQLTRRHDVAKFLGPLPLVYPDWVAVFSLLSEIVGYVDHARVSEEVAAAEAAALFRRRTPEVAAVERLLGIPEYPRPMAGELGDVAAWNGAFQTWVRNFTDALAQGRAAASLIRNQVP